MVPPPRKTSERRTYRLKCEWGINALVGIHLDYCNSLFRSLSVPDRQKLQYARIMVNTTRYSHITPVRVFIGCLSSIALFSRQPYWCKTFCIVVIQNTLNLSLNPDIVCTELIEVNLMTCCLRSHTLDQYI